MNADSKKSPKRDGRMRGFTLLELVVVMAVVMTISGVALPSFLRTYQFYQVTDAATRMANLIKSTRYEAIRRNTTINYVIRQTAAAPVTTTAWTDSNRSGVLAPADQRIIFGASITLVAAGTVPNVAGLTAAVGMGALTPLSNTNDTVQFDQRGAAVKVPPAAGGALVSYVSNTAVPSAGYRAIILLPSGSMQLWKADVNGNWTFLH